MHDADAFAELIRRFEGIALSIAYSTTGNSADAGDVTQDAFLRAWQRLDSLEDPSRFGHWLGRMVRNLSIDLRRKRRPGSLEHTWDISAGQDPSVPMEQREARGRIDRALETLDDITRQCVTMRYYENLSSKEIGSILDLSPAAIDMRLSRARTTLRETLAEGAET